METLTKEQAIEAMKAGKKVRHLYFTDDEYMYMPDPRVSKYKFEDGHTVSAIEFFKHRTSPGWENDWSIWS